VNAGVSGETTSGLLERLDWLLRAPFDVMVLETGANDGLRGIPAATVRQNIRTALTRIRDTRPTAKILLVQMEVLPNLGPQYAAEFHALYSELAKEMHVALMPFLLDGVAGRSDLNQSDGIHPNQRGEHIVADNVWKSLRPLLDSLASASP
jgi:acyl-CoA thioesterase-1